jgi:hypothetical protein
MWDYETYGETFDLAASVEQAPTGAELRATLRGMLEDWDAATPEARKRALAAAGAAAVAALEILPDRPMS